MCLASREGRTASSPALRDAERIHDCLGAFSFLRVERKSPCKINLLLNVLGKRADGFHELEMVMHPVDVTDTLHFERRSMSGVELTCSDSALPVDASNLVHRAATRFLEAAQLNDGIRIHIEKRIPMAAGLGGGSSNAATTLLALNDLFGRPVPEQTLSEMAAAIGSDVPFFLQHEPALVLGRGERILPHPAFPVLSSLWLVLVHPGFGVATAWAYRALAEFPDRLNGRPGRAEAFIRCLEDLDVERQARGESNPAQIGAQMFNSLEGPVLKKFPVLALYQEFFRSEGAIGTLMSGSGSTTFALVESETAANKMIGRFQEKFGCAGWIKAVSLRPPVVQ